ncbi:hypothetical protein PCH_Pc21g22590 [Penicillium rubens Wisconsin 54-1255]|uniref:Uncharacterized protein n=1 Tax=Penicillium rubens (strain ATCC 28089 / DSM 1075 / NRRL 1951 / Wisconsin 54-1255) TaxID=500485 RepID=B6HNG7_PENRW|nr:hypothetical protein PCH_Pc21g22590 [Penicillium rubens Wisconsin 54-1255]
MAVLDLSKVVYKWPGKRSKSILRKIQSFQPVLECTPPMLVDIRAEGLLPTSSVYPQKGRLFSFLLSKGQASWVAEYGYRATYPPLSDEQPPAELLSSKALSFSSAFFKGDWRRLMVGVVDRSGLLDQSADCPEAQGRATVLRSPLIDQPADCPEAVRPSTVRLEVVARGGLIGGLNPATVRLEVVDRGGYPESTDCPEAERPGTVRLEVVYRVDGRSGWSKWVMEVGDGSGSLSGGFKRCIEVDGWIGLLDQSADCPEAEARHGQTGSARHGQTGSGCSRVVDGSGLLDQSADCPEALRPATIRLEVDD